MLTAVLVALCLGVPQAPPPPPSFQAPARDVVRRPPVDATGTAVIRGRVVMADTGAPVRRATVNLAPAPPATTGTGATAPPGGAQMVTINGVATVIGPGLARPRSVSTNAQGAFEFKDLPAGTYRLIVLPGQFSAAYLGMAYGARKPNAPGSSDLGTPIQLGEGQTFDKAQIALVRGGVIAGRVTDEDGVPLARVQIYTIFYPPGSSRGLRAGGGAQTDDLGQFRVFGLGPGDYVVAAEARANTFVPPNAPPETEDDKIGFLTTFFPAAADEASAQRVRTRIAGETPGIEIRLLSGRLFHVTGVVSDSQGRPATRSNGTLSRRSTTANFIGTFGFSTDEQGRFQMRNIPPGSYRLTVRQPSNAPRNPDGSPGDLGEFASVAVTVASDLDGMGVVMSPGATISGNVFFENGPPQPTPSQSSLQMRVGASSAEPENFNGVPTPPPALVAPDLSFTMKGLMGELLLRTGAADHYLKAVLLGTEDITDTPHEFRTGERVTLVLTSRASTVEGSVTDAAGRPVTDAALILFSEDKASWRANSVHTRRGGVDVSGHFRLPGVLPGRYFLIAMPRDRSNALGLGSDPAVFEALTKEATPVVVGDDEQRQVDLRISDGGQ